MVRSAPLPLTRSLIDLRTDLLAIVRAGIGAAHAGRLVEDVLAGRGGAVREPALPNRQTDVRFIAAGKAAAAMAAAAIRALDGRVRAGVVIGLSHPADPPTLPAHPAPFESFAAGHPIPTAVSEQAGLRALALVESAPLDEVVLVLLSGGASALMAVPADGLTLEDKRRTTATLLRAGADIETLNVVRKHLSAIKGGWLAVRRVRASRGSAPLMLTLALSDVVGDDLSAIASGPTVPDASTFGDAYDALRRFGGLEAYPASVVGHLDAGIRGERPETPKPADPVFAQTSARVIGGRRDAMDGAVREAEVRGYHVARIDDAVIGDAATTARSHLRAALARAAGMGRPACIVSSGETTVRVMGHGKGGRNQEFALALADALSALGAPAAAASVGTDGVDGPTDAAGAIVDTTTRHRADARDVGSPARFLADNNAYAYFDALGDLIRTGPTDTNVGDLQVLLLS